MSVSPCHVTSATHYFLSTSDQMCPLSSATGRTSNVNVLQQFMSNVSTAKLPQLRWKVFLTYENIYSQPVLSTPGIVNLIRS